MLTMAILAIIGAFLFGFALSSIFAVGAAADRSDRRKRSDAYDVVEVAVLCAAFDPRPVRHPKISQRVSPSSTLRGQ